MFGGSYLGLSQGTVIKEFLIDIRELHKKWYDWTLKDGKRPAFLKKNIAYYVMGAEVWNYADRYDTIPSTPLRLYLRGKESSADVGSLSKKHPAQSTSRKHSSDPLDTRPGEFEIPQGGERGSSIIMSTSAFQSAGKPSTWNRASGSKATWTGPSLVPKCTFRRAILIRPVYNNSASPASIASSRR
jgi:hypothetical protein